MGNRIFYFTASGNSLATARTIAARLGDTDVLPMAEHLGGHEGTDEERIGLVFPVYLWSLPRMVSDFAHRLRPRPGQYVFAIVNCGGTAARTLIQLRRALRSNGSDLRAGFVVRGDFSAFLPGRDDDPRVEFFGRLLTRRVPPTSSERMDEIVDVVRRKEDHGPETTNAFSARLLGPMLSRVAQKELKEGDRHFSATDACVSCGTCVRVCPRENVTLEGGLPAWHHDCETCYACLLWCPEKAIAYSGSLAKDPTHHPDVTLDDALLR